MPKILPFSERAQARVIKQQAEATIQHLMDAVVELETNCDDSYERLEEVGKHPSGKIEFYVSREKGGKCRDFKIRDYAEGMSKEALEKAISYGEESSGFIEGKSVRGLLGRGLKESLLGLGEGYIYTKQNGKINCVKMWWDEKDRIALYDFVEERDFEKEDPFVYEFINSGEDGTLIKIKVENEKIIIPEGDKFTSQLRDHYALRDINSSEKRSIMLTFEDFGRRKEKMSLSIKFDFPEGELILDKTLYLPHYNDAIEIKIWESPKPLASQMVRYNPYSKAGVLIKTKGAILDNQLFKYDNDPAAFYFRGEAYCESIAERIREASKQGKESDFIDLARKGLNWRSAYCEAIQKIVEYQLAPLVQKKKKELEKGERKVMSKNTKRTLENICKLLDKLATNEIKDWDTPVEEGGIEKLTLVPAYVNIEANRPRALSIYAPKELVQKAGNKVLVMSESSHIKILFPGTKRLGLTWNIDLEEHPTNPNAYYKSFKVLGKESGKETFITCKLGNQKAEAVVKVVEELSPKSSGKKKRKKRGGFISKIDTSTISNPIQRVEYEENLGAMKIYVNFPGVRRYLTSSLKEIESREDSRAILAELIGEAFCKTLARKKIERTEMFSGPGGEIDTFNSEVNDMQKKYLDKIHEIIAIWQPR